ncbi:hypothetical protein ACFWYW_44870 [Nonomuraea sp. NPDC059023]|uniref:hypothetical protein n=1 Tax=unclassified Nonomuraea TaxID=2593643 RepID=UPI0036C4511A
MSRFVLRLIRVATEDVELPSGKVKKGEGVIASFTGADFDPSVFPSPGTLDLDRTPDRPYPAFGRGLPLLPRRRPRPSLLGVLVQRLPDLSLAVHPDDVTWTLDSLVLRPPSLPVSE